MWQFYALRFILSVTVVYFVALLDCTRRATAIIRRGPSVKTRVFSETDKQINAKCVERYLFIISPDKISRFSQFLISEVFQSFHFSLSLTWIPIGMKIL